MESYYNLVARAVSEWAHRYQTHLQAEGQLQKLNELKRITQINLSQQSTLMNVSIDIDTLQSLSVYLVLKLNYAHLISDYQMIHDFVSRNVKLSARFIYLNLLKGGTDYLLEMALQTQRDLPGDIPEHTPRLFGQQAEDYSAHGEVKDNVLSMMSMSDAGPMFGQKQSHVPIEGQM